MEDKKKKCIACKESIWADASICSHCQTPQSKQFHKTILLTLKELSAVTVVITLIFAMVELNRFADSWFEDSAYASRLAASASMLMGAGEFTGARKLLQEAKEVYPASEEVGAIQKQLAMISIRKIGYPNNSDEVQVLKDSLYSLYRNLGGSKKSDAAVLAHIARASRLLWENGYGAVDIGDYLDKALALNRLSVYANTFKGIQYMRLYRSQAEEDPLWESERTMKAQQHFNLALQQNIDTEFVREIQLSALGRDRKAAPASEYVKVVLALYTVNDEYAKKHRRQIISGLSGKLISAVDLAEDGNTEYVKKVFFSLNVQEMDTLKKLFTLDTDNTHRGSLAPLLSAMMSEDKGEYLQAINGYINISKMVKGSASMFRYSVPKLLKKLCSNADNLNVNAQARCDEFFS